MSPIGYELKLPALRRHIQLITFCFCRQLAACSKTTRCFALASRRQQKAPAFNGERLRPNKNSQPDGFDKQADRFVVLGSVGIAPTRIFNRIPFLPAIGSRFKNA